MHLITTVMMFFNNKIFRFFWWQKCFKNVLKWSKKMSAIFYHRNFNKNQNKCSIFIRFPVRKEKTFTSTSNYFRMFIFYILRLKVSLVIRRWKEFQNNSICVFYPNLFIFIFFYYYLIRLLYNKYIGNLGNIFFCSLFIFWQLFWRIN